MRRYHDSLTGFTAPSGARWRLVAPGSSEVICHNDWSPSNARFHGHEPVAMLDWDSASPGSRDWDVALSAYSWVPLFPKEDVPDLPARAKRFARFCAAYDADLDARDVFDILPDQLRFCADFIQREADAGDPGFAKLADWHAPARLHQEAASSLASAIAMSNRRRKVYENSPSNVPESDATDVRPILPGLEVRSGC